MPLPAGLLKTVLVLEELHDFTREFTATGGEAYMNFLLKRCLQKRLRHVQVKNGQAFLVCSQPKLSFLRVRMRAWGRRLMIVYILDLSESTTIKHPTSSSPLSATF